MNLFHPSGDTKGVKSPNHKKRGPLLSSLVIIVTIVLLGVILSQVDYRMVGLSLHRASLGVTLLAFVLYILTYLLRAWRWRVLVGLPLPFISLFHIVCLHTLANNLFPFRTGELTFPYFLRRFHHVELSSSLSSLLLARVSDMLALGLFFITALIAIGLPKGKSLFPLVVLLLMALLLLSPGILARLLSILAPLPPFKKYGASVEALSQELRGQWKGKRAIKANLLSLSIWGIKFLAFLLLIEEMTRTVGFPLTYWKVILGTSASELTTVLPIHSIGGIGTYEAGWTGAFILMGMARKTALTTAFLFHLVLLFFSVILGLPSYLMVPLRKQKG